MHGTKCQVAQGRASPQTPLIVPNVRHSPKKVYHLGMASSTTGGRACSPTPRCPCSAAGTCRIVKQTSTKHHQLPTSCNAVVRCKAAAEQSGHTFAASGCIGGQRHGQRLGCGWERSARAQCGTDPLPCHRAAHLQVHRASVLLPLGGNAQGVTEHLQHPGQRHFLCYTKTKTMSLLFVPLCFFRQSHIGGSQIYEFL